MKKLSYLIIVLAMVLPLAIPFGPAIAQQDTSVVQARLEEYNANLPPAYGNISVVDLSVALIDNPDILLVDVRQPEEYADSHIPDAFNLPLRELAQNLDALPELDADIVIYCGSAFRSAIAMTSLQILGYTNVQNMAGGFRSWLGEELPTTTDVLEAERSEAPDLDADVLAAIDAQLSSLPDGWGSVSAEQLNVELIESPPDMLIDVRKVNEWEDLGYIAGAVNMPLEELMSYIDELPADMDANIVIYCAAGHRGNMAATMLRTLGYTNVRNLAGGFNGWANADLPVEGGAPPADAALDMTALLTDYIAGMPESFNAIRVNDLNDLLASDADVLLVDVRTVDEFVDGHLEGAINVPIIELTDHLDMLPDLDADIVVYCGSGHRSALGMAALNLLGYNNALSLLGGVRAWTGADLPVVTEATDYEAGTAPDINAELFEAIDTYVKAIPAGYYTIGAEPLNVALIESPPVVIDVRTDAEWEQGYIPGAVHLELRYLRSQMDEWPQDTSTPIVVYSLGHRSVIAMMAMQLLGYEDVHSLAGGINAWTAADYPVETP